MVLKEKVRIMINPVVIFFPRQLVGDSSNKFSRSPTGVTADGMMERACHDKSYSLLLVDDAIKCLPVEPPCQIKAEEALLIIVHNSPKNEEIKELSQRMELWQNKFSYVCFEYSRTEKSGVFPILKKLLMELEAGNKNSAAKKIGELIKLCSDEFNLGKLHAKATDIYLELLKEKQDKKRQAELYTSLDEITKKAAIVLREDQ